MRITKSKLRLLIHEEFLRETEWSLPELTPEMLAAVDAPMPGISDTLSVENVDYFEAEQAGDLNSMIIDFGFGMQPYEISWDPELEYVEKGVDQELDNTLNMLNRLAYGDKTSLTKEDRDQLQNSPAVSSPQGSFEDYIQELSDFIEQSMGRTATATASDIEEQPARFVVEAQVVVTFADTSDVDLKRTLITILDTKQDRRIRVSGDDLPVSLSQDVEMIDVESWAPEWTPRRTPDEPRNPIPSNVVARDKTGREFRLPMKRTA
jgi:hypothetical protein